MRHVLWCAFAAIVVACGSSGSESPGADGGASASDDSGSPDATSTGDGAAPVDAATPTDGSTPVDGSTPPADAGPTSDSGAPVDAGNGMDATSTDSGGGNDAAPYDAGSDASGVVSCTGSASITGAWPLSAGLTPSAVGTDATGNVYVAGTLKGTASWGTTMVTATGNVDFFLGKMDATGHPLWIQHYGSTNTYNEFGPLISVDAAGDVFLAGFFSGSLSFGGTASTITAISVDAFTARVSTAGVGVWADHFGYDQGPYAVTSIALDAHGDVMIGGTAGGTIVIGNQTWTAPDPVASGDSQAFIAKIYATDGVVAWSNASGGDLVCDSALVTVDSAGRSALAMRVQKGSRAWGVVPVWDGGGSSEQRVGFDVNGTARWSHFDYGGYPQSASTDEAGRISLVVNTFGAWSTDGASLPDVGEASISVLFDPNDGEFLSAGESTPTFPWTGTTGANGFSFATGQFQGSPGRFGNITIPSPGSYALYVAELDPTSHFVSAIGLGGGNTQPTAITVGPSGNVLVAGTTQAAFTTPAGSVPIGGFVVQITPPVCATDLGPPVPQGDGSPGDLLDGAAPEPDAGMPATCPSTQTLATNGAACPVDMGCAYGNTCCICQPTPCGNKATTWTCTALPAQPAACPATPPQPGEACSAGTDCTYCEPGGRFFANCTAGGWETGYAQVVCN
jgi:hypothetical protein